MRTNIPLEREYRDIPNMAFYKIIRRFAFEKGLPNLTWSLQWTNFRTYIEIAKRLN